jgi:hypothetical protein
MTLVRSRQIRLLLIVVCAQIIMFVHSALQYRSAHIANHPLSNGGGLHRVLSQEWVALAWALLVVAGLLAVRRSHPNARLLLGVAAGWTLLHGVEHFYLLYQYARVNASLDNYRLPRSSATTLLPGILGHDGWLASAAPQLRAFFGPVVAAPRLGIHLGWAVGDVVLPCIALPFVARQATPTEAATKAPSEAAIAMKLAVDQSALTAETGRRATSDQPLVEEQTPE